MFDFLKLNFFKKKNKKFKDIIVIYLLQDNFSSYLLEIFFTISL